MSGTPTVTHGEQVLQSLGMSPEAAAITYGVAGAVPPAAAAAVLQGAAKVAGVMDDMAARALLKAGGVVDSTGKPLLDLKQLTNQQKAVTGDLFGEQTVRQIVPDGSKIGRTVSEGQTGIDDLYKVSRPDVDYVVIEYKFDTSKLGNTADGKQMSDAWLRGDKTDYNRILESVGREQAEAVTSSLNTGRVEKWVVRTLPDGSTQVRVLDGAGNVKPVDASKILLPPTPLNGAKP
jgi:filamentous hemagglutinin